MKRRCPAEAGRTSAPLWRHWGMPTLASVWGGGGSENSECPWPLRKMNVDWPIAYWIPKKKLPRLKKELVAFRTKKAIAEGIPEGIPRFSEGEWPIDVLANELDAVVRVLRGWCKASDVLVWHDGPSSRFWAMLEEHRRPPLEVRQAIRERPHPMAVA